MKVKVKRIKRTPETDLQLAKSKIAIKARELSNLVKSECAGVETVTFYFNLDGKTPFMDTFFYKNGSIDERFKIEKGGLQWNN